MKSAGGELLLILLGVVVIGSVILGWFKLFEDLPTWVLFIVTMGTFTRDAETLSRQQESRKITLINGTALVELWIEYQDKISPDKRDALPLKPIYFLSPKD